MDGTSIIGEETFKRLRIETLLALMTNLKLKKEFL